MFLVLNKEDDSLIKRIEKMTLGEILKYEKENPDHYILDENYQIDLILDDEIDFTDLC